jgi:hypothetical protein
VPGRRSAGLYQAGVEPLEAALDLGALGPDGADLLADLVLGPALFGGQVQEVVFLAVEPVQLADEVAPHLLTQAKHVVHGGVHPAAQLVADLGGQPDVGDVVIGDGVLEYLDEGVGQVAAVLLLAAAEEVEVLAAVALSPLERQPAPAAGAPELRPARLRRSPASLAKSLAVSRPNWLNGYGKLSSSRLDRAVTASARRTFGNTGLFGAALSLSEFTGVPWH